MTTARCPRLAVALLAVCLLLASAPAFAYSLCTVEWHPMTASEKRALFERYQPLGLKGCHKAVVPCGTVEPLADLILKNGGRAFRWTRVNDTAAIKGLESFVIMDTAEERRVCGAGYR